MQSFSFSFLQVLQALHLSIQKNLLFLDFKVVAAQQQQQQLRLMQQDLQAFVKDKLEERQQGLVCFFVYRTLLHVSLASPSA